MVRASKFQSKDSGGGSVGLKTQTIGSSPAIDEHPLQGGVSNTLAWLRHAKETGLSATILVAT